MKKIEWGSFDGSVFQQFCNSVIMLEVSKLAHVFNAAGKDDGVDQYYDGNYDGGQGKWRFQDKFHNSGNKTNDITAFKRDIITDITENYDGENFIVYLTNVNFTKAKFLELTEAGKKALEEKGAKDCKILIWHEPKLLTILETNPVLYNWYWEKENVLLQDYRTYFKPHLDANVDLRYQLNNSFFGRTEELKKMDEFLVNPTYSTMAVVANGGYGKTRLCIELFSSLVDRNTEWVPVVLTHSGFSPASLNVLLRTQSRLLILIDNANEAPDVVNDVKQLIDNSLGKHKLLITARRSLFSMVLSKTPAYRKEIEILELQKLKYEETKEMVASLLPYLGKKEIISLANLSKGVPNVVLELARIVRMGKQPAEISTESIFSESVFTIIREVASDFYRSTNLPVEKVFDFLKLISVISPVPNNKESLEFIASMLDLRTDKLELLVNSLSDAGIIENHITICIKPDPYSDAILVDTIHNNKGFIEHIRAQPGMESYFENILKNLAEAELSKKEVTHFIQDLLVGYVAQIEDRATSTWKLKAIINFVSSISYTHPHIAVRAIRSFITIYAAPSHPMHEEPTGWSSTIMAAEIKTITDKIISQVYSQTQYGKDNLDSLHDLLVDYVRVTEDYKIVSGAYGFHEWDFQHGRYRPKKCCERQDYFKGIIADTLTQSDDPVHLKIALQGAKALLELDYQLEGYFEEATLQFTYGTGYVLSCPHTKEIRSTVLRSLMIFFRRFTSDAGLRAAAFAEFMHFFFHSSKNHSSRYRYEVDEDVTLVLEFLYEMISTNLLKPEEKALVLEKARLFKGVNIRPPFVSLVDNIIEAASATQSLYEDLEMCVVNQDYFDARKNLEPRIKSIVETYNDFSAFRSDLIKAYREHQSQTETFGSILDIINRNYPTDAKEFFDHIMDKHEDLIITCIGLVSANYKDPAYFYAVVERLWKERNKYDRAILWLLTHGRQGDRSYYRAEDLNYFEAVMEEGPSALNKVPIHQLPEYAYINKDRAFRLLDKVIQYATGGQYNLLTYVLFDENSQYGKDFPNEIKEIVFTHPEKIIIDEAYYGDHVMSFLEDKFGFSTLLEFVYLKVKVSLRGEQYKYVTLHEHTYTAPKTSTVDKDQRYLQFLNWFMTKETKEEENEVDKYVMKLFRPSVEFSSSLSVEILRMATGFKTNAAQLSRLAEAVRLFPPTTEELIITLARIAELASGAAGLRTEKEIHEIFGTDFYYSTGGVKSKSGRGVPFPEDVKKRDLFKKVLEENQFIPVVESYLRKCQERAQRDIDEEIARDNEEIRW